MIIKYIDTKYSYLKLNSKIKNEFSYIYNDKYLNDSIYVLNSNLIRQSFVRKKHLIPWWFTISSKNISIYKIFSNKWDIFHVYPLQYNKTMYNKKLIEQKFYYSFYKKYVKSKRYSNINFKYLQRNFKYLIKWRNKQRFVRVYSFYKIFKQVRKFWKRGMFITYKGHIFSIKRRFIRLKKSFVFFRTNIKYLYKDYLHGIQYLFEIFKNNNFQKYLTSKLNLYYLYFLYLLTVIRFEFDNLKKVRLNKKGPFYSYYMFRKKPLWVISSIFLFIFKQSFKNKNKKYLNIQDNFCYNYLKLYYLFKNPLNAKDYYAFFYLYYLNLYKLLNSSVDNTYYYLNDFNNIVNIQEKNIFNEIKIIKNKSWQKYHRIKPLRRFIFRKNKLRLYWLFFLERKNKHSILPKSSKKKSQVDKKKKT